MPTPHCAMTAKTCANFSASSSTRWMKCRNASKKRPWPDNGVRERVARDAGRSPLVLRLVSHRVSSRFGLERAPCVLENIVEFVMHDPPYELTRGIRMQAAAVAGLARFGVKELQRTTLSPHHRSSTSIQRANASSPRAHAESGEQLAQHRLGGDESRACRHGSW